MLPAEHKGFVEKRTWHKVRWARDPPGIGGVAGKFDLLMDEELESYREFVDIIKSVRAEKCESGLGIGFGKSEAEVDEWIRKHSVR